MCELGGIRLGAQLDEVEIELHSNRGELRHSRNGPLIATQ
jgi:hypothetical protein